jgi:hypothetical protein
MTAKTTQHVIRGRDQFCSDKFDGHVTSEQTLSGMQGEFGFGATCCSPARPTRSFIDYKHRVFV